MGDTINEGDHVVLMKSFDSGNMKIVAAKRGTIVHYGKLHFDTGPLVGRRFGSVFEIRDGSMELVEDFDALDEELSSIVSSKMSTFDDKSQFSQEKIIKRKKRRNYANIVASIKPTLLMINEMLYSRDKLGGLRLDLLSQILTLANIQNGSKTLLLDHNLGILTSAVVSRIIPDGTCIQLASEYENICTTRKTLAMLNISKDIISEKLVAISLADLYSILKNGQDFKFHNEVLTKRHNRHLERLKDTITRKARTMDESIGPREEVSESEKQNLREVLIKKELNRRSRYEEKIKAASLLQNESLDSIIIVVQNDEALPIIKLAYPLLAPSRQFVVYSDSLGPLLQSYLYLKSNLAVSLSLSESWLRHYQVLPDRTRPEMNVSGYGGYLLSGTKGPI